MAFLDDLAKATAMFKENAEGLALQRSIGRANEAVQQIKAAEGNEQQKRSQLQQLANALTMDLASVGAPAERIALVAQSIAPKSPMFQTPEQALINEGATPEQRKAAEGLIARDEKLKLGLKGMEINAMTSKQDKTEAKERSKQLAQFQKQFVTGKQNIDKALVQARNATRLLDSGNPLTAGAIGTMLARASGEVGNLTEAERAVFEGRQDLVSVAKRLLTKRAFSDLPKADKEALREIAQIYTSSGETLLKAHAETLANQASLLPSVGGTVDELLPVITGNTFKSSGQTEQKSVPSAGSQQAPAIPGLKWR